MQATVQRKPTLLERRPTKTEFTRRTVIAGSLVSLAVAPARSKPDWPDRPVTIVHGFPPGGDTDVVARTVADRLAVRLGQRVVVESKPGASGTIAAAQVARTAPDGYTLLAIPDIHTCVAATFKSLPYRTIDDFSIIAMLTEFPLVMATYSDHSIGTVADLVSFARARNSPLVCGIPGHGTTPHLAIELLAKEANIKFQLVPYRGAAPLALELVAKRLDFVLNPPATVLPFIRDGKLRALAVTGDRRFFALRDVPSLAESVLPGYVVSAWMGLIAPAGLPEPIVSRLNVEVVAILQETAVVERLRAIGNEPKPTTPEKFKARMAADIAKWTAVVEGSNFERI